MAEYSIAPLYDLLLFPFVYSLRLKILDHCLEKGYASILDVCCGTGNQLKMLKRHGFNVTGVDLSNEMLQVSQRGRFAPDCRFEDASRMSFADSSFEMAMTTFALHEKDAATAGAIIREMVRVVRPGGKILLIDFHFTEHSSWFSRTVIRLIEWQAGGEHYRNFRSFIAEGGIRPLFEGLHVNIEALQYAGMGAIGIFVLENGKS